MLKINNFKNYSSRLLFILWAGGAALLSYSLIYALRKPYTSATFEGIQVFGVDYKVVVTIVQILGHAISKFIGIKLISELKRKNRFKFIIGSMVIAEIALILFGLFHSPYNLIPMFINSLSLGCMWGFIFSYMEGRKLTDILASFMGVSMVISSGTAKSVGLYMMNVLKVNEFWMPALIGAIALPILISLVYILNRLPEPNLDDIESKSKREPLNNIDRIKLVKNFALLLIVLFIANVVLTITRDIKKDFLVNIVNTSEHSNWLFAQIDTVVTIIVLVTFCLVYFIKNNLSALKILLFVLIVGMCLMAITSLNYNQLKLDTVLWLFIQSLCL